MKELLKNFVVDGEVEDIVPFGEGHINSTYKVTIKDSDTEYVLQKLNTEIFKNYEGVIDNIRLVTSYLKDIIVANGGDPNRETMTLIPTKSGKYYHMTANNECYRLYILIPNSICYQSAETPEQFASSGEAFGKFMRDLDMFDVEKLADILPNFHNTEVRYENFANAIKSDKVNRLKDVQTEVDFFNSRKKFYSTITSMLESGDIPTRVTHNDTKLNNILFDANTDKALCIIDLDTIMAGSLLYDFGDSVRFGCSTAREDEEDTSKIHFDINLYESYVEGFLKGIGDKITCKELENLHNGAIMMTLECGMRFLTDYLEGDTYFKTAYSKHNLVRAHSQMILAYEMEQQKENMISIAKKYAK